ncbi:MAG TPA: ThuA domain-containing protein [Gaiellales bacterium]|jgi:trehalose utilization protein
MRVLIWNEHVHELERDEVAAIYPAGIHGALRAAVERHVPAADVAVGTLAGAEQGLGDEVLEHADVLVWWGHIAQEEVRDDRAEAVAARVRAGMGLVVLHSGHISKPFRLLMGTSCMLRWREGDDRHLMWTVDPAHPLAAGLPNPLDVGTDEMYGEPFAIPKPDELVFISGYSGGEVFRSGCCFRRGNGRIAYLSPGHETYPVYHNPLVGRLIANAVAWAAPVDGAQPPLDDCVWSPAGWFDA